jgi:DNA-binding YbaB/EbfC family protein
MSGIDFNALFQQAQALQQEMEKAQAELAQKQVTGSSGGGMVTVTATGKGDIVKVQIDPQAVDPRDVAMLEDLVLTATNAALANARQLAQEAGSGPLAALQGMIPGIPR